MMLRRRHRATSTEAVAPLDTSKYDGRKKAELQGLLKERDLPTSGKVEELVQRLAEHDASQPADAELQTGGVVGEATEATIGEDGPEAIHWPQGEGSEA